MISPQTRLRPISPFSYVGQGHRERRENINRRWTQSYADKMSFLRFGVRSFGYFSRPIVYEFAFVPSSNEMSGIEKSIAPALELRVTEAKFICVNSRSSAVFLSPCPLCLCGEISFSELCVFGVKSG
jgi:hypothetical protein